MDVALDEEVEVAETLLDEGVEVGGGVICRVEFAEKVAEHAHVGQLPEVDPT